MNSKAHTTMPVENLQKYVMLNINIETFSHLSTPKGSMMVKGYIRDVEDQTKKSSICVNKMIFSQS
jgi:hypothetical protein